MSLHIDLFKSEEKKDPLSIFFQTACLALLFFITIGLCLFSVGSFLELQNASFRLSRAKSQEKNMANDFKRAASVKKEIVELTKIKTELVAFSNAQLRVSNRLYSLSKITPSDVQLLSFSLFNKDVANETIPARKYSATLEGRTKSEGAETRIQLMINTLTLQPVPNNFDNVIAGGVKVDPRKLDEKTFEIRFDFSPRNYK